MGLTVNSRIVYDGLVICYDPSNPVSYPGSGNIIYDISGNGNNGDLTSTGFSTSNQGHLTLNGTSSFIQFPSTTLLRTGSCFSIWFNVTDFTTFTAGKTINSRGLVSGLNGFSQQVAVYNGGFGFETDQNSNPQDIAGDLAPGDYPQVEITSGVWINFAMSFASNIATIYINGEEKRTVSGLAANLTIQYIGNILSPDNYPDYFKGGIGSFFLYDRALTSEEIKLNYNASKLKYLVWS